MQKEYEKNEKFFAEDNYNKFENKILEINYLLLIIIGIVIFFIGSITRALTGFDLNWSDEYKENIRAAALIIMNIGILNSTIGFMIGALKPSNLDIKIRSSMIIATGSCLIAGAVTNMILFM